MSIFCGNCGNKLDDNAIFCDSCGAKTQSNITNTENLQENAVQGTAGVAVKKSSGKKLLIIGVIIAVVAILFTVLLLVLTRSTPEKAVDNYFDAILKPTTKNVEKLVPEEIITYMIRESYYYDSKSEFLENLAETFEEIKESFENSNGYNIKIEYNIEYTEEVSASIFNRAKGNINDYYAVKKNDITKMVEIGVNAKITGSDDETESDMTLYAIKISGKWFLTDVYGTFVGS